jgi:hypothetical protein
MVLKLTIDSLEAVDEPLRALYTEKDGKYQLAVDGIEDTSGLKNALAAERKRAADLEKRTKAWEKSGKSPDEIAELIEAAEAKAMSDAERKGEWDKLKNQLVDSHAKERAKDKDAYTALESKYRSNVIDRQAVADIAAEGGVPDLLLPHVQRYVRTDENYNPIVVDAGGTPRLDTNGNPLTIRALIQEMKTSEIFGRAFNGSGHTGSGTQPGSGTGGTPQAIKSKADIYRGIDPNDKKALGKARANFVEKFGTDAYFALPR